MTPHVPTPMDHFTALVSQDSLEMVSLVLVMTAYLLPRVLIPFALPIIPDMFRMKYHPENNKK